jgi:hypothetical protein
MCCERSLKLKGESSKLKGESSKLKGEGSKLKGEKSLICLGEMTCCSIVVGDLSLQCEPSLTILGSVNVSAVKKLLEDFQCE